MVAIQWMAAFYLDSIFLGFFTTVKSILNRFAAVTEWGMSAGKRIKKILEAVSSNRVIGCLTGAGVTAMVQSSSATTVMLIGFVSAGLMTLQQAVGVILGANIGTTMTAQLIAFKLTEAALPAIAIGVFLKFFTRKKKYRYIGEVILGFGLLFFGMTVMKHGLAPIKTDPTFIFNPGL